MKNKSILLLAVTIGLMLTACGNSKETAGITPDSTVKNTSQEESQKTGDTKEAEESTEAEALPDSQEYYSSDGSYKVTLIKGVTQKDMQLAAVLTIMGLDSGTKQAGFTGIALLCDKSNAPFFGDLEGLEDFADCIATFALDGSGITINWKDTDAPPTENAIQCLAREGIAVNGMSRGQAYGYHVETADSYYSVVIVGYDDDVEEARQILALEILDKTPGEGENGTNAFINGMTAVLDSVNGINVVESRKFIESEGDDKKELLDTLSSGMQQTLSESWGIENADDLIEMADWLMEEGHNKDALGVLDLYDGTSETSRDAFEAKLKEQNADDETYIRMMAAYDAWSAYGDNAIAAWDLSRVGTIMGTGYGAGYCTYEEAMDKILEAAVKSQELFDSWEDFNQSYLYGYSFWTAESLDDAETSAAERAALVDSLESQTNGPFAVEWNTELKKEW